MTAMDVLWTAVPIVLLIATPYLVIRAYQARRRGIPAMDTAVVGRRVSAHIVDALFVTSVYLALDWIAVELAVKLDLPSAPFREFHAHWTGRTLMVLFALDFIALQAVTGYTLGKWLLRIRTVDAGGGIPGWKAAFLRSVPLVIEWIGLIALWAMNRHPQHQRFGDRWAHTFVVADGRKWPARARTKTAPQQKYTSDDPRSSWA